jgi:hypothetical protein
MEEEKMTRNTATDWDISYYQRNSFIYCIRAPELDDNDGSSQQE